MRCPGDRHATLQRLQDHGPLTVEQLTKLLWKGGSADHLLAARLLAHLIDHSWVQYEPLHATFALTDEGREAFLACEGAPAAMNAT